MFRQAPALGGAVGGGVIAVDTGLIPAAAAVLAFLGLVILLPVLRSRTARAARGAAMAERKHETTT
ncbi:hypothetical protein ACR820_01240 [Streptomyces netropsis]